MPELPIKKLLKDSQNPELIESAFEFAINAYKDKNRISGENYIYHALRVAAVLDKMKLDPETVAFGLLHDVIDDIPPSARDEALLIIKKKFGKEMSDLIEKISKLAAIRYSLATNVKEKKAFTKEKIENLRKMFFAIAGDPRVILVELISRIDALNFLNDLPVEKQKIYSLETLKIFVPIARRLGLSGLRRDLEDISFSYLFPKRYAWLKSNIKGQYEEREKYIKKFIPRLEKIFKKERIKVLDINYRAKSYWSTYQKLLRKNMDFDKVHDLIALRIIVEDIETCYKVLGIIHKHFAPISEEINDYIAKPKPNGYRSLHTTVFFEEDKISEIQIRTEAMQKEAEYGIYAHWAYKEKVDLKKESGKFQWTEEIPDFWNNIKINFFQNQIFAFTPKRDVISLPKGSTVVDFAYAVHSDIGNHCESAKINGKIVQLNHVLESGDIVEITTNKKKQPSRDWLKFVKTNFAKSHIKKIIAQSEPSFAFVIPHFIKKKISEIAERAQKRKEQKIKIKKERPRQLYLAGQTGMLFHIAKCCHPGPDDQVSAYLTKYRSAVLHKTSCENFQKLAKKFPDKIITASFK